jgi:hypothetical protein
MTADLVAALEFAKYAARKNLGVVRGESLNDTLMKCLNKAMILQVLSDASCLEELTTEEVTFLEGVLILHS